MGRISLVSLGCPKNLVDSDDLLTGLRQEGFVYTPDPSDADVVLINTCGFVEDAKRESIDEILRLADLKNQGAKLLVFGCLAQRYRDELIGQIPEIDALWGVGEIGAIIEYCRRALKTEGSEKRRSRRRTAGCEGWVTETLPYAYLKIAEGCGRGCTYCVIPSIRGPFRSDHPEEILRRAQGHLDSGKRELILIAQDIGSYGREWKGYNLASLVRDIAAISGEFWVRLLYLYPTTINDELLSAIADNPKVCRYLDVPLQHSEEKMLRLMGRGGTRERYRRMLKRIREALPDVTLRTTFIIGFPGETDRDFRGLRDFIEEVRFERLGVFLYSKEEGTPAASLSGGVTRKVMEERREEIMRLQAGISLESNQRLVGHTFRALVDEVDDDAVIGRLGSQAPEIDGVVFVEGKEVRSGEFADVLITRAFDYDLQGIVTR